MYQAYLVAAKQGALGQMDQAESMPRLAAAGVSGAYLVVVVVAACLGCLLAVLMLLTTATGVVVQVAADSHMVHLATKMPVMPVVVHLCQYGQSV